jgi:multiple antibiotic resistance protein
MPDLSPAFEAFIVLSVVIDPIGNVPIFLALTAGQTTAQQRHSALQATLVAGGLIGVFALVGRQILTALGIGLPALQVAGGLLLALIALDLLRPHDAGPRPGETGNIAFVPLGTPLLAGPGAIATTMLAMEQAPGLAGQVTVAVALVAVLTLVYLVLRYSALLGRVLRTNGINLVTQVMGLLAAAIAVQFVAEGIEQWVRGSV